MTIGFKQPLMRLPIRFDTAALQAEVAALPRSAWVPHPDKFPGNDAVRLISIRGGTIMLSNDLPFYHVLERLVFEVALASPASPAVRAA